MIPTSVSTEDPLPFPEKSHFEVALVASSAATAASVLAKIRKIDVSSDLPVIFVSPTNSTIQISKRAGTYRNFLIFLKIQRELSPLFNVALGPYEFSAKFRVAEKKNRPKLGRTNRPPKFLYEP